LSFHHNGVERARSSDPERARSPERWLATVIQSFGERILPIDQGIADEPGRMGARRPISMVDALLAATARFME